MEAPEAKQPAAGKELHRAEPPIMKRSEIPFARKFAQGHSGVGILVVGQWRKSV